VLALAAFGVDGDPIGVGVVYILMRRVRIGPADHVHAEFAAACDEVTKRVHIAEILAAIVERNLGRIVRDAAAGGEASGVGMRAAEVVQPERRIVLAGIVFDKRQLRPTHGSAVPGRRGIRGMHPRLRRHSGKHQARLLNEISSRCHNVV